eukprot:Colp12_sorted_trinity150504_noHs@15620
MADPEVNNDDVERQTAYALYKAAAEGDVENVRRLLKAGAEVFQDELGRCPLHLASANGHLDVVCALLEVSLHDGKSGFEALSLMLRFCQYGHPWNAVDKSGKTTGEYAREGGHDLVYQRLLEEGVRAELIFAALNRNQQDDDDEEEEEEEEASKEKDKTNATTKDAELKPKEHQINDYLKQTLTYDNERLMDQDQNAVMMEWEEPLMELHASLMCPEEG